MEVSKCILFSVSCETLGAASVAVPSINRPQVRRLSVPNADATSETEVHDGTVAQ